MSLFSLWSIQTDTFSFTESQIIILVANTLTEQSYLNVSCNNLFSKTKNPPHQARIINFLPDEGDHIIYSLFHADRHAGFEPELQIIIVYSYFIPD